MKRLKDPDFWEQVAKRLNRGSSCWYDLADSSHAMDVAQIVCTEVAHLLNSEQPEATEVAGELFVASDKLSAGDALVVLASGQTTPEDGDHIRRIIMQRLPGPADAHGSTRTVVNVYPDAVTYTSEECLYAMTVDTFLLRSNPPEPTVVDTVGLRVDAFNTLQFRPHHPTHRLEALSDGTVRLVEVDR